MVVRRHATLAAAAVVAATSAGVLAPAGAIGSTGTGPAVRAGVSRTSGIDPTTLPPGPRPRVPYLRTETTG